MSENREFFKKVGTAKPSRLVGGSNEPETAANAPPEPEAGETPAQTGAKRWAANYEVFWGATQTYDELPPALYACSHSQQLGPILVQQRVETDDLLDLPDDAGASVIAEFVRFWEVAEAFHERGFLHKRGFLLWGPPGSGKTTTLHLLLRRLIEDHQGVALFVDHPSVAATCLHMARQIEWERPLIGVLEDLDALVARYGENEFLALLDGEAQVDNIVFVATTNYPERLDKRFVDRPSRFDTVRYIGMPSAAAREVYFKAKEPSLKGKELEQWVGLSDGFSIAHLKEMIIANRCFGQPIEGVAERLAEMHDRQPTSDDTPDTPSLVLGFQK